ncbi:MAG: T9SS type A sorting domain-containing protein [Bacteroidota bacterium]
MKRTTIFFLLLCFCFVTNSIAQQHFRNDGRNNINGFYHSAPQQPSPHTPVAFDDEELLRTPRQPIRFSSSAQLYVVDTAVVLNTSDTTRYIYSYNTEGRMTLRLIERWLNGQWKNFNRYAYGYDAIGNLFSELVEKWSNEQWGNNYRYTYSYDINGDLLSVVKDSWVSGNWMNFSRSTYTYEANGNLLSVLVEYRSNLQWVNSERYTYMYDISGNQLSELRENWENEQWVNYERSTYTYDANGNRLTNSSERWSNGQWVNDWRFTHTYDANGNLLSKLDASWWGGQWVLHYLSTYTYIINGNLISILLQERSGGQWLDSFRSIYAYDTNGNMISFLYERKSNGSWITADANNDVSFTDSTGNRYSYTGYNITLKYKLLPTSVGNEQHTVSEFTLSQNYPNPFNPQTAIGFSLLAVGNVTLKVYDIFGREVAVLVHKKMEAGKYSVEWNAESFASGMYFYRLAVTDEKNTTSIVSKKMILMK